MLHALAEEQTSPLIARNLSEAPVLSDHRSIKRSNEWW